MTDNLNGLKLDDTCPACGSASFEWKDGDHTFPVGADFDDDGNPRLTAELTVRVPIGTCGSCKGQFLNWVSEYVTEAAARAWREQ